MSMQSTHDQIRNSQTSQGIFLQPIDQQYQKKKSETYENEEVTTKDEGDFFDEYEQGKNMGGIFYLIDKLDLSTDVESINGASRHYSLKDEEDCPTFKKGLHANFTKMFLCESWKSNLKKHVTNRQAHYLSIVSHCSTPSNQNSYYDRRGVSHLNYDQLNASSPYYMTKTTVTKSCETFKNNINSSNIQKISSSYSNKIIDLSSNMINPFSVKSNHNFNY